MSPPLCVRVPTAARQWRRRVRAQRLISGRPRCAGCPCGRPSPRFVWRFRVGREASSLRWPTMSSRRSKDLHTKTPWLRAANAAATRSGRSPHSSSAPISMSSDNTTGEPGRAVGLFHNGARQRRRPFGIAETGHDHVGHHHRRKIRAQLLENADLTGELGLAGVEHRELFMGVDGHPTETGKVLAAAGDSPGGQSLVEQSGEDHDTFGIVAEAPSPVHRGSPPGHSRSTTGARSTWTPRRRQAAPAASPSARTARRPAFPACCRCRQLSPQGAESVDDAALEVDRDKGRGLKLAELFHEGSGLFRGHDVAGEENDTGRMHPLEDLTVRRFETAAGNSNNQGHDVSRSHQSSAARH